MSKKDIDILSKEKIEENLHSKDNFQITIYRTVDSTNTLAKQLASTGAKDGTIIISEEQTAGKGRLGRKFYSPFGAGIYMSIILRPKIKASDSILITSATSVAIYRAVKKLLNIDTSIKWVNDIYLHNKKLGGILVEGRNNFSDDIIEYLILGIGLNFNTYKLPREIDDIATSLFHGETNGFTRNQLIAAIINEVYSIISDIYNPSILDEYKKRSYVLNKEIKFIQNNVEYYGKAININSKGFLIVELADKSVVELNSSEISLRNIN